MQIAAFSLYLTALELDPDPLSLADIRFETLRERNLFTADAFDENASFNRKEPFIFKREKDAPAVALIAEGCELEGDKPLYFVNVERSEAFKRHGILEIGPENVKKVSVQHLLSDTDVLKIASWGNARDMA